VLPLSQLPPTEKETEALAAAQTTAGAGASPTGDEAAAQPIAKAPDARATAQTAAPTEAAAKKARVARYTDLLLHGKPGDERPPPAGLVEPRYAWPPQALPPLGSLAQPCFPAALAATSSASSCSSETPLRGRQARSRLVSPPRAELSPGEDRVPGPDHWFASSPGELSSPWPGTVKAPTLAPAGNSSSPGEVRRLLDVGDAHSVGELSTGALPSQANRNATRIPGSSSSGCEEEESVRLVASWPTSPGLVLPTTSAAIAAEPGELSGFAGPGSSGEVSDGETQTARIRQVHERSTGISSGEVA